MTKVVISHPAQQHSYALARAMEYGQIDYKYVTTVYAKKNNMTKIFSMILSGDAKRRAISRKDDGISDDNVIQFCEFSSLLLLFLQRVDKRKIIYDHVKTHINKRYARKLSRYLKKNNIDKVVTFDQYSHYLIKELNSIDYSLDIILDMSAPSYKYMVDSFNGNINGYSIGKDEIKCLSISDYEIKLANKYLVASEVSLRSVIYSNSNISINNIFLCKYGVENLRSQIRKTSETLNVCFIGRLNRKKGFDLFNRLAKKFIDYSSLNFWALGSRSTLDIGNDELSQNIDLLGHIPKEDVVSILDECDLLIMPSLADGYGLVVTEALSRGVVVLCSDNVGASSYIVNRYNGYIFESGSFSSLEYYFNKLITFRVEEIDEMKNNALLSVKDESWSSYYKSVLRAIFSEI
ncbi:glycosyltransferase family 4 protein [Vibrio harveyi]|uniref:glycosyltransferase family 4 protein n=1 Tax=Vibrio harveyi TaxID=669 RepID=UPI0032F3D8BD|nr:glycosyltransferase [Vibrio harveyi]